MSQSNANQLPMNISLSSSGSLNPAQTGPTTFILNPSNSLNATSSVHSHNVQSTLQPMINSTQMNPMIAGSPLVCTGNSVTAPETMKNEPNSSSNGCFANVSHPVSMTNSSPLVPSTFSSSSSPPPPSSSASASAANKSINSQMADNCEANENIPKCDTNGDNSNEQNQTSITNDSKRLAPIVALDRQRLQELVQQVDPNEQLEEEVEDALLSLADDFIEAVVEKACMICKHRKSSQLEVKDIQLALDFNWNMWIPGFGVDGVVGVFGGTGAQHPPSTATLMNRAPKKCMTTEAHKQRMALIKKVMKKF